MFLNKASIGMIAPLGLAGTGESESSDNALIGRVFEDRNLNGVRSILAGCDLEELRKHHYALSLGGHFHTREKLLFETGGIQTRFHQASAVKGDYLDAMGMQVASGVTLYSVSNGEIDDGTLIPLN